MPWEKSFDVDRTLEKAGEAFWSRGYEATSMRDLLDVMGIQKGSFYNAYGSKHQVYLRALEQYSEARLGEFEELISGLDPLEALRALFEAIRADCLGPNGHRGCMVINCALEVAHEDPEAQRLVGKAIGGNEKLIEGLVRAGQDQGRIDPVLDPSIMAKSMMSFIMGMRVYSRSGSNMEAVSVLAEQALGLLRPPPST